MSKLNLIVLANDKATYSQQSQITTRTDNEFDTKFTNENNFDDFRGLVVNVITFIGNVEPENVHKFSSLIRN